MTDTPEPADPGSAADQAAPAPEPAAPPAAPAAVEPDADEVEVADGATDETGELDDDAAELDDADDTDPGDDAPDDTADDEDPGQPDGFTGYCRGGPYNGRQITSRFPKGFLLADKIHRRAFVYDYANGQGDPVGIFTCRNAQGAPLDTEGRWRAAMEFTYDVMAFEPIIADAEQVHA